MISKQHLRIIADDRQIRVKLRITGKTGNWVCTSSFQWHEAEAKRTGMKGYRQSPHVLTVTKSCKKEEETNLMRLQTSRTHKSNMVKGCTAQSHTLQFQWSGVFCRNSQGTQGNRLIGNEEALINLRSCYLALYLRL